MGIELKSGRGLGQAGRRGAAQTLRVGPGTDAFSQNGQRAAGDLGQASKSGQGCACAVRSDCALAFWGRE